MKTRSLALVLALLGTGSLAVLQTGCVAVAAVGAGSAVAYIRGELSGDVQASLENALEASNTAIAKLKFAKVSEKSDALSGTIIARTADDKKVEIRVERVTDTTSKVKIRVGVFGDQMVSMQVWERVKNSL